MRYLKNVDTAEVTNVPDDDDKQFDKLKAERRDDGTPQYVQTGPHDPAVDAVEVSGQDPANGEANPAPGGSTPTSPIVPAKSSRKASSSSASAS